MSREMFEMLSKLELALRVLELPRALQALENDDWDALERELGDLETNGVQPVNCNAA